MIIKEDKWSQEGEYMQVALLSNRYSGFSFNARPNKFINCLAFVKRIISALI